MNHEIIIDALEEKIVHLYADIEVYETQEKAFQYLVRLINETAIDKRIIMLNIKGRADKAMNHDGVEYALLSAFHDYDKGRTESPF